ncbi:hypothetical protein M378DRAFT_14868 [Amanita muscaria Koide BX008]|uniref:Major facilitator superfamily (MFS) profile domain-containing protein n=1 Tax=Amanita muscaria (strain Koide BX008) TaxID=946122 RepID=A0A0C2S963_AMAMK|nr:hypothetical protein M378DRAFT_14868 [Amanita muscaria Koide BX008]
MPSLVAGIGFLTDAYDIFVINLASTIFPSLVCRLPCLTVPPLDFNLDDELSTSELRDFCLKVAAPVGTLFGQDYIHIETFLFYDFLDGIELMITIVGTFSQALAGATQTVSLVGTLIVWRFIMGVGVGGDCPLTAIIVAEFAPVRLRGRLMAAVFACQGWGDLGTLRPLLQPL